MPVIDDTFVFRHDFHAGWKEALTVGLPVLTGVFLFLHASRLDRKVDDRTS